jgi:acetyl esterase/lipase
MACRSYLHRYGNHPEQVAELHLPPADPRAVVVLVHGGFWRERYSRDEMARLAEDLVARGLGAWNVEYRRLDCGGGWPTTVEDVRAAVGALRALGHEPAAAIGHSAGGHLALWLADLVPRVVGQAAVSDLVAASRLRLGDGAVDRFAGDALEAATPPLPQVPTLLVHGTADDLVPVALSVALAERAGDHVALSVRAGEGHFEHIDPRSEAWQEVVAWLDA